MMHTTVIFEVPAMTCGHCEAAVTNEVTAISGVDSVAVDLETKLVTVTGTDLDRDAIVAAIDTAGFDTTAVHET
jgi:copper chaperone CopZ